MLSVFISLNNSFLTNIFVFLQFSLLRAGHIRLYGLIGHSFGKNSNPQLLSKQLSIRSKLQFHSNTGTLNVVSVRWKIAQPRLQVNVVSHI